MANRFPLIVNPDTKEIQEISQNDNLDLTGNGVYAGGSLGSNGQVLSSNGTTVEWRTLSGGGGGGGIDLNTTYVLETEELADGINLNLIAGGTGVGTLSIKYEDTTEIQFDAPDDLTLQASIKDSSIGNTKLVNNSITMNINGVNTEVALGGVVSIPIYGDVFKTSTQELSNKTFKDCSFSFSTGTGNTIGSIPNDALLNHSITINGTEVDLGGSITVSGGGGGGASYSISAEDWSEGGNDVPNKKAIRLTGSDQTTDNVLLVAGDRISLTRNGDEITITGDEVDTDTDTTYGLSADTLIENTNNVGARLRLTDSDGNTELVKIRNGTGVTVNSTSSDEISISIPQDIRTTSNVTFNNLTVNGGLTVSGALSYINTTNLKVSDKTLTIADGVTTSAQADASGILIGTSNINFVYEHNTAAWTSSSHLDLVPTKSYKIGGTVVLSSNQVLGKSLPTGDVVGTSDFQTLSNKTILSPVMTEITNTGTVYFPAPNVADWLVARNTADQLTNKTIDGDYNTLQNIGNNALSNSYMIINGTQRNLGDTFTVTATDPYDDEQAQDAVAGMITNATHTGISWTYDDTAGTLAATVTAGGGGTPSSISDGTSTLGFNSNNELELACHIIPDTNAAYDLGSAEYKIRHLFLSQNTLYYEGEYLKVAQHNAGQGAGQASYMLPLSKIKEVLNASVDFETFKANMIAIVDAAD